MSTPLTHVTLSRHLTFLGGFKKKTGAEPAPEVEWFTLDVSSLDSKAIIS